MNSIFLSVGGQKIELVVSDNNGEYYAALKPLCEALGVDWRAQHKRTQNNPQFRCGYMDILSESGVQETVVLPVTQVGMWLCTISARRVSEDVRPKLLAFQEHLQGVIHDEAIAMSLLVELEALKQENLTLKEKLCASNALDRVLVSNEGTQLAAQRRAKKNIN